MPCKLFEERHVVDVLHDKATEGVPPARPVAAGIDVRQRVVVNVRVPVQALGVARPRYDGIGAEPPAGEGIVPPRCQGEARRLSAGTATLQQLGNELDLDPMCQQVLADRLLPQLVSRLVRHHDTWPRLV